MRVLTATAALLAIAATGVASPAKAQSRGGGSVPNAPSETALAVAPATPTQSSFDVSFGGSITSDYNYRGYTLSDHRPSASANFEVTYNVFFAGLDGASVRMPKLSQLQMTNSGGIRPVFGTLTMEAGVLYYSYPGSDIDIAYQEYYVAPTYAVTSKLTLGLNVYYAPDYSRTGAWENYNSVTAKYKFDSDLSFSAELGHQSFGTTNPTAASPPIALPDYTYWNLGFSYVYKAVTMDLRYYASTLSRQSCYLITGTGQPGTGSNGCSPAGIATLSWSFP
jgi:uncharacterized protein (TIGR02001 family)